MAPTALSMPRFSSIGLAPAATSFEPSLKIACASTVAVVVPSPATSEVFEATSFTICAPMFSYLPSSSTALATVTPSLVTVGEPKLFSMMTLRPLGPRVTATAFAIVFTPSRSRARASSSKQIIFAAILVLLPKLSKALLEHREDVFLAHDQVLFAVQIHFRAAVLAEQDPVAGLHAHGLALAVVVHLAGPGRDHAALLRLLLGGVGDDDPARRLFLAVQSLHEDPIVQGSNFHGCPPGFGSGTPRTQNEGHRATGG